LVVIGGEWLKLMFGPDPPAPRRAGWLLQNFGRRRDS